MCFPIKKICTNLNKQKNTNVILSNRITNKYNKIQKKLLFKINLLTCHKKIMFITN